MPFPRTLPLSPSLEPFPRALPSNPSLEPFPRALPSNPSLEPFPRTLPSNPSLEPLVHRYYVQCVLLACELRSRHLSADSSTKRNNSTASENFKRFSAGWIADSLLSHFSTMALLRRYLGVT